MYVTTYCNHPHDIKTGKPINHECYVLPPLAIALEMKDRIPEAIDVIQRAKPLRVHRGIKRKENV
jgi:hypothetical protein